MRKYDQNDEFPVRITRAGRDAAGGWYVEIAVQCPDGQTVREVLSLARLSDAPNDLFRSLAKRGLYFTPAKRAALLKRLETLPAASFAVADRVGWHKHDGARLYVKPERVFGPDREDLVVCLPEEAVDSRRLRRGSFAEWQKWAEAIGRDNPLLVFAACVSVVGPVLRILKRKSIGFMLVGPNSTGKTTATVFAGSIWGTRPDSLLGHAETWLKTAESFDHVMTRYNDGFLGLDETKLAGRNAKQRADVVADVVFRVGDGLAKERFADGGPGRAVRLAYFTTSNETLREIFAQADKPYDPSYDVRLLEIPVFGPHGVFHKLPQGMPADTFADTIRADAQRRCGFAIDCFLERLAGKLAADPAWVRRWLDERIAWAKRDLGKGASGPAARRLDAFCVTYAAGRLASRWGILPWPKQTITAAVRSCYSAHAKHVAGQAAAADPVTAVRAYIVEHHRTFYDAGEKLVRLSNDEFNAAPGFITRGKDGAVEFCFSTAMFSQQFGRNGKIKPVLMALQERNLLIHDADKNTAKRRVRANVDRDRVYCIADRIYGPMRS